MPIRSVYIVYHSQEESMHAIKAIYNGVSFMPKQSILVKGKYEVVVTFV